MKKFSQSSHLEYKIRLHLINLLCDSITILIALCYSITIITFTPMNHNFPDSIDLQNEISPFRPFETPRTLHFETPCDVHFSPLLVSSSFGNEHRPVTTVQRSRFEKAVDLDRMRSYTCSESSQVNYESPPTLFTGAAVR